MYPREDSDLWSVLQGIVHIGSLPDSPHLVEVACGHLGAYLGGTENTMQLEALFTAVLRPDSVPKVFSRDPDTEYDVAMGRDWLQTLPPDTNILEQLTREENVHRATTFLARTFLYVAYAESYHIPLTSDTTRVPILEAAVHTERNLRQQLLKRLNEQSKEGLLTDDFGGVELTREITPLASVVFERAYPDKKNIAKEMQRLREQLAPIRVRIADAEMNFNRGSRQQEIEVDKKWQKVFDEIERQFGKGEGLLKLSSLLGFSEAGVGAYLKPGDPKGWFKLIDLPLEVVRRIHARRAVVELHRIRPEIPSSGRLWDIVTRLFGDQLQ
jgi:hypothetical protein